LHQQQLRICSDALKLILTPRLGFISQTALNRCPNFSTTKKSLSEHWKVGCCIHQLSVSIKQNACAARSLQFPFGAMLIPELVRTQDSDSHGSLESSAGTPVRQGLTGSDE